MSRHVPARRPMPSDFAEYAAGRRMGAVMAHYGAGYDTITRWVETTGVVLKKRGPGEDLPADFAEHAARETRGALEARYGLSRAQINRLLTLAGITPVASISVPPRIPARKVPEDFAIMARRKGRRDLAAHYTASPDVVRRWCREAKVTPIGMARGPGGGGHALVPSRAPNRAPMPQRDVSLAGQAAEHLRRTHANVFRAEILPAAERKGLPDGGKGLFVVSGKEAMTGAALIDLAKAKGFDPNAWARV